MVFHSRFPLYFQPFGDNFPVLSTGRNRRKGPPHFSVFVDITTFYASMHPPRGAGARKGAGGNPPAPWGC